MNGVSFSRDLVVDKELRGHRQEAKCINSWGGGATRGSVQLNVSSATLQLNEGKLTCHQTVYQPEIVAVGSIKYS